MTHVRAIRKIVGPQLAREKLVEKRRLVAQPPRGVESRLVRIVEAAQVPPREFEGFIPTDRHVFVRSRVVAHRLRQASGRLERIIGPPRQLLHGVRREKIAFDQLARQFPCRVLDAIFADVHAQSLAVIGHAHPGQSYPPFS
jgi:hypothetical protein